MGGYIRETKKVSNLAADRRPLVFGFENHYQHTKNWFQVLKGAWNLYYLKHRAEVDLLIQRRNTSAIQHRQNSNSHSSTAVVASRCRCTAASWWTADQYVVDPILSSLAQEMITLPEIKCSG